MEPEKDDDLVRWAVAATKGLKESGILLSLFSKNIEDDPIPVLQLGYALVLDKPILIVAPRGTPIPENVKRVAKAIVFYDLDDEESVKQATLEVLREAGIE